jgi:hypothetical protein
LVAARANAAPQKKRVEAEAGEEVRVERPNIAPEDEEVEAEARAQTV